MGTTLIRNGTIIDGSGSSSFTGNILIDSDQIEAIIKKGESLPSTDTIVDATDCVIAPGFIDMHSHSDWVLPLADHPKLLKCFLEQGITTVVTGNCGISPAPINQDRQDLIDAHNVAAACTERPLEYNWHSMDDFLNRIENVGPIVNVAQLVGHGAIRYATAKTRYGTMKPGELQECLKILEQSLTDGACGLSFGLGYAPGMYSSADEIESFCRIAKYYDKPVTVHIKSLAKLSSAYPVRIKSKPHNIRALSEILEIARNTGIKLQISHLLFVGCKTWPTAETCIEMIENAHSDGNDVMFDAFPYTCSNSTIDNLFPSWFIADIPKSLHNPFARIRLWAELAIGFRAVGLSHDDLQVMDAAIDGQEDFNGLTITEVARKWKTTRFRTMLRLSDASKGATLMLYHRNNNEKIVESVLSHDLCLFETDAVAKSKGYPNPGTLGAFPKILGRYVRERKLFSIENAIRRMTFASANRFGINDRGVLQSGKAADIVIFDPQIVSESPYINREPTSKPSGISHVFLNGEHVVKNGEYVDTTRAGRVLRL